MCETPQGEVLTLFYLDFQSTRAGRHASGLITTPRKPEGRTASSKLLPTPQLSKGTRYVPSQRLSTFLVRNSTQCYIEYLFPGSTVTQPIKSNVARAEPDRKGKETYANSVSSQSEETRKRSHHPSSDSGPPDSRRRVEVFRQREDSPCTSSDQASDSEEEDERETQWDHASSGKHVKNEDGTAKQGNGKIHNGRAVIQHLKSVVTSSASNIKTEQEVMGTNSGGRWSQPPSRGGTNGSSPPSKSNPTEAPPKGLFNPPSPTLSPPISTTPLARDDRSIHGGRASDFELLQRLTASGAAGRVLFHPLALGPQGPQSLYAPSTIRYAPAEMPAGHAEGHRSDYVAKTPAFFPHLQRIASLPPFSGFSPAEPTFPPTLPFCMNGLRGAAGTEED